MKAQLSTSGPPEVLIYSEDRAIMVQTELQRFVDLFPPGVYKLFLSCTWCNAPDGQLLIEDVAEWQDW